MAESYPWDLTEAYVNALASWYTANASGVRVMAGPVRSCGTDGPVCIVVWSSRGKPEHASIGNVNVTYGYSVELLVPDDETAPTACERLRQELFAWLLAYHAQAETTRILPNAYFGEIGEANAYVGNYFKEASSVWRVTICNSSWKVRESVG